MAADDRDWYRERAKKTMQDHYYNPKLFRGSGGDSGRAGGCSRFAWGVVALIAVISAAEWNTPGMSLSRLANGMNLLMPGRLPEPTLVIEDMNRGGKTVRTAHMVIGKDRTGQFATTGTIEGVPVTFSVNRAESRTLVPAHLMKPYMATSCVELGHGPSDQIRKACNGYADGLVFGVFALPRIPVIFMPGIGEAIQLGADVMAGFEVEQTGSQMLIRSKDFKIDN